MLLGYLTIWMNSCVESEPVQTNSTQFLMQLPLDILQRKENEKILKTGFFRNQQLHKRYLNEIFIFLMFLLLFISLSKGGGGVYSNARFNISHPIRGEGEGQPIRGEGEGVDSMNPIAYLEIIFRAV